MIRTRLVQLVAVAGMALSLLLAGLLSEPINAHRAELMPAEREAVAAAPAEASLIAVLGAGTGVFRGLAADIAWYRAERLKQEGMFHEADALAEWITYLQPHFPAVWVWQAWNMAYNISVETYTPRERWDWVNRGVSLLRDKGIPLNPRAVVLYKELAYFFFHKIGGSTDDMHWAYKRALAAEWQEILGAPAEGGTVEQALAPMRAVVAAADTWPSFLAAHPEARPLAAELTRLGYDPDVRLLRQIGRIQMFHGSVVAEIGVDPRRFPQRYDVRLLDVLARPGNAAALPPVQAYLRKQALRQRYHMRPDVMLRIMQPVDEGGYGFPWLDWRHPVAHALYWGILGTEVSSTYRPNTEIDLLNTYRVGLHSSQALTSFGRVVFDPFTESLDLLPDPRFIPTYEHVHQLAVKNLKRVEDLAASPEESYAAGRENFLLRAVVYTYLYGDEASAREYYGWVRRDFGSRPGREDRYTATLDELVLRELTQNIDMREYALQFVDSMLVTAVRQGWGNGWPLVAERHLLLARQVYEQARARSIADPRAPQPRLGWLSWDQTVANSFLACMRLPVESVEELLLRSRAWRNAPAELRQRTCDALRPAFAAQVQPYELDVDKTFPLPPGMEEYRKSQPAPRDAATGARTPDPPR